MSRNLQHKISLPGWLLSVLVLTLLVAAIGEHISLRERGSAVPVLPSRPGALEGQQLYLVAEGAPMTLNALASQGAALISPWSPLPTDSLPYAVAVSGRLSLPVSLPGWSVTLIEEGEQWLWYQVTPPEPLSEVQQLDLMAALDEAQVYFSASDGEIIPCTRWHFGRWLCGPDEWLWVGQHEMEIQGVQRSCIWAHPRNDFALNVQFEDLPPLSRLNGRYGMADTAVEMEGGAPVQLSIAMGDRTRALTAENQRGFFSYHLSAQQEAGDAPTDVRFTITSEDAGRRHFCFTARAFLGLGEAEVTGQDDVGSGALERGRAPLNRRERVRVQGSQRQGFIDDERGSLFPSGGGE